jgi:hypothetical protein
MLTRIQIFAAVLMTALYIPAHTHGMVTKRVPDTMIGELNYLLSFVGNTKKQQPFMPEHIKQVLDFVVSPAKADIRYQNSVCYHISCHHSIGSLEENQREQRTASEVVGTAPESQKPVSAHWCRISRKLSGHVFRRLLRV